MGIPNFIEAGFQKAVDLVYSLVPQPSPELPRLKACRIISHRGVHDNRNVFENTLPAFDRALSHNIWGIEFDLRWTRDLEPVVFHDATLKRLFGSNLEIRSLRLTELRQAFPQVPSLYEVIDLYGGKMHLMMEIKSEAYPNPEQQNRVLDNIFSSLKPVRDFHLLSIDPGMFDLVTFAPASAFLPVAMLNVKEMSSLALDRQYGGFNGHYLLVNKKRLDRHHHLGQMVGTGYPRSKNCLFREINRGVDWIFSNHAVTIQKIREAAILGQDILD